MRHQPQEEHSCRMALSGRKRREILSTELQDQRGINGVTLLAYIQDGRTPFNSGDAKSGAPDYYVMKSIIITIILLTLSNIFMTFAWYAHLKELNNKPWVIAALISWGIAFFEYMLQVPANRIGYSELQIGQLKILQEVITLSVFLPFALFYLREPLKLDYLWAALCILGAVFFIFRSKWFGV